MHAESRGSIPRLSTNFDMKKTDDTVTLTAGELADLIDDYEDSMKDPEHGEANKRELKALLFDMRRDLAYALRLIDAEAEIGPVA